MVDMILFSCIIIDNDIDEESNLESTSQRGPILVRGLRENKVNMASESESLSEYIRRFRGSYRYHKRVMNT